ncbi:uncharacterized protein TNCV_990951 [Trichonephila clavipes]|nr:uncharacterized protein TNCV_990951 [Trichonephila clavipes]
MSRRGKCSKNFTDNATNFVGANSQLKAFYKTLNFPDQNLAAYFTEEGIEWNFIPPRVPHMGDLWEAGIKSVKYHLKRVLGRSRLTYEEFETVIIQVEGILNFRPLTQISNDFDNFEIKPLVENNKGNSGSLEKMEYRLSEYSPTERRVDDREGQCNVWYKGNCKGGFYTSLQLAFRRVEDLEKKLPACGNEDNERKFVPASPVPMLASPVSVKLSTYDGKTNWEKRSRWSTVQTLPNTERLNLSSLYNALDLRFGQKYSKNYARLQMKTRLKKTGESLQEYASEIERLANLAFSDYPANMREIISLQYFVDGLKDGYKRDIRMTDAEELKSALLYALKLEAATQASHRDRHSIRGARLNTDEPCESRLIQLMEKLKEEMQTIKAGIPNQEKHNLECWGCGGTGHMRRSCPRARNPAPLKTRRVGQRSTLNLSRAETSSRWCGSKENGGASSGVVHVT